MSGDGGDFATHRLTLLDGIKELSASAKELAREQARHAAASDANHARILVRVDDLAAWRMELERRLREDFERRLREVESTRSQALVVAALGSVIFGAVMAAILRLVIR
jgi:hypothetical protein